MSHIDTHHTQLQRLVPNFWCQGNASEVADHIVTVFNRALPGCAASRVSSRYPTEGLLPFQEELAKEPLTIEVTITGPFSDTLTIVLINAGKEFMPNPSISLMVNVDPLFFGGDEDQARTVLRALWEGLSEGGTVLMPIDAYPFSALYGWVEDRFHISWQLILTDPGGDPRPFMMPAMLFANAAQNRAMHALEHYTGLLPDSGIGMVATYPEDTGPAHAGAAMFAEAYIAGEWLVAMDSGAEVSSNFSCGVSLELRCDGQEQLDHVWDHLSRVPDAEVCGWCEDEFGVSWQVTPMNMPELMEKPGAFETLMNMKKIVIDEF